ncbi:MAG TPA: adenylosuccinate synthetase [Candidatus Saccharimonadales bacterium]|nr:adenylosuccinate synthetase [Candidatus Saccharimonadales bacterium]
MPLDVIVGLQRGDEGKGRFVDLLAGNYSVVARGNGGSNAGHTVIPKNDNEPLALHQVPSGIAYPGKLNIIGNGLYLDPVRLLDEFRAINQAGLKLSPENLLISSATHLVLPHHKLQDALREATPEAQGSTKAGIAYVAADKYLREGVRLEGILESSGALKSRALESLKKVNQLIPKARQLSQSNIDKQVAEWLAATDKLKPFMADTAEIINEKLQAGAQVLAEGAQAFWLDINHGMYPAVTSSNTTVSGLLDGLGVSAKQLGKVIGVTKAVKSHVGNGPLVTEVTDAALADNVRGPLGKTDSEYGVTTKRPRRIGFPDLVELRNAILINGVDELAISKLDHVPRYGSSVPLATTYTYLGKERRTAPASALALAKCKPNYQILDTWKEELSEIRKFNDLPANAAKFVEFFETELAITVTRIGVGPRRPQVIIKS